MMKIIFLMLLCAIFTPDLHAQEAVTSSGGDASGSGGTASYSTGQVAYTAISGTGGTATQGVQQPYEIYVLGKDNFAFINLSAMVYPNPTVDFISLRIESLEFATGWRYEMFDLNGRFIAKSDVTDIETIISMEKLPDATYILKVYAGTYDLKSFKIIKKHL